MRKYCLLTPQIGLETVGVDDGNVGLNCEQRRAGLGNVLGDMPSSASQDLVNGRDAVLRRLDLDKVDRLRGNQTITVSVGTKHRGKARETDLLQSGRRHQEGRIADSSRRRDDLSASSVDRLLRQVGTEQAELDVPYRCAARK